MSKRVIQFTLAFWLVAANLGSRAVGEEELSRDQRLAEYLSGTQFVGKFTVDGADLSPKTETYTIKSCEKLPAADLFRMTARIKYGSVDQEVPLDLKILWSGNTPVITLDSLWIPGMGTFDARVLIRRGEAAGRYAGTWQHGDKGGHLFGAIVPIQNAETESGDGSPSGGAPKAGE
jgi:hypothetical protein